MSALRALEPDDDELAEVSPLASVLAHAYWTMARFYRDQMEMSGPDASARASGNNDSPEEAAADLQRIRDRPPDQTSWFDLQRVVNRDPAAMADLWHDLRADARDELASGHRTAQAHAWQSRPWDRARFLAVRDSFRDDYRPRPGIESALVDLASEAYGDYLQWSETLHMLASTEADLERHDLDRHGKWKPQRLSSAAAMEHAAQMADRTHARFLRTIAALEARRHASPVHVGPVTIAHQAIVIAQMPDNGGQSGKVSHNGMGDARERWTLLHTHDPAGPAPTT